MIVNETETRNFSAVSAVNVENGQAIPVLYMGANYDANNGLGFTKTIRNVELYKANKEEADKDWEVFQASVEAKMFSE